MKTCSQCHVSSSPTAPFPSAKTPSRNVNMVTLRSSPLSLTAKGDFEEPGSHETSEIPFSGDSGLSFGTP